MNGHMQRYMHGSWCLSDPGPPPGRTRTHRYPARTARAHLHTEPLLPRQSTIHSSRARALDFGCGSPCTPRERSQHGPTHPTHAGEARARASTSSARPRALLCTCIHTNGGPDERSDTAERAEMGRVRGTWAAAHLLSRPRGAQKAPRAGQTQRGRHRSTDRSMAASAA